MACKEYILLVCVFTASWAHPLSAQSIGGCGVYPANNVWNTPIDKLPVDANSAAYINTIGATKGLHPDFSSGGDGIPYVVVPGTQPKVPVTFRYSDESDPGPYPVPANAPIEGGASSTGDRHVLVVDSGSCLLYELFAARPQTSGGWTANSGAIFDLKSNALRPDGWTSSDAAGFAILPGLVRYDEVAAGEIKHAIRMTAPQTRNSYIWPARHEASSLTGSQYPPLGQRFRLKASFDITPYTADVQVILTALKKYGAFLADNGSSWYLTGAPDPNWNDDTLHKLGQVLGSNLEAVDESSLTVDPDSGAVPTTLTLSAVRLSPVTITGGVASSENQVVLSGPAPAGGASVALSSSNLALASVPATVLVPAGASAAPFSIKTGAVAVATPVTISAFYLGVTASATLTVTPAPAVSLASFKISPSSLTGGWKATGSVTLSGAAPSGGISVTIASSDSATASAPATVTAPSGASSASFTISTVGVPASKSVMFTASYGGVAKTATLTVTPAPAVSLASFTISPSSLTGGGKATGLVTLTGAAPSAGIGVKIASSDNATASVPETVMIPSGASSASFTITTTSVSAAKSVTLKVSYGSVSKTAAVTVNPAPQTYTLHAPTSAAAGATITVDWTAPVGHTAKDYLALYSTSGQSYWSKSTGSAASGSFTVPMPTIPGQYYFRYIRWIRNSVQAQTPNITVQ